MTNHINIHHAISKKSPIQRIQSLQQREKETKYLRLYRQEVDNLYRSIQHNIQMKIQQISTHFQQILQENYEKSSIMSLGSFLSQSSIDLVELKKSEMWKNRYYERAEASFLSKKHQIQNYDFQNEKSDNLLIQRPKRRRSIEYRIREKKQDRRRVCSEQKQYENVKVEQK